MTELVVARARLYEVALPLREPFRISGGVLAERRSLIVELEDRQGLCGYGEAAPFAQPFYSAETIDSARPLLRNELLPRLVGRAFADPADVHRVLSDHVRGNPMARAGAETAWWDLRAAAGRESLAAVISRRLGELGVSEALRRRHDRIACGIALGIPPGRSLQRLSRSVEHALERGYRRVKLKIMPGWDVEPCSRALEVIRSHGSDVPLTADANGAYSLTHHMRDLLRLDALGLSFLEQPLAEDALWDARTLSEAMETPICLDESLTSDAVARQIVEMGGPTVWNLKVQRVGGLEEACRMYARAVACRIAVWGGTMPETGVGAQAMLALGSHAGFAYPSDLEPSERWYEPGTDLVELEMDANGQMRVPDSRVVPNLHGRAEVVTEVTR